MESGRLEKDFICKVFVRYKGECGSRVFFIVYFFWLSFMGFGVLVNELENVI